MHFLHLPWNNQFFLRGKKAKKVSDNPKLTSEILESDEKKHFILILEGRIDMDLKT